MAAVNIYLNFPGTTEEAFNFYKTVFGGEFLMLQRFKEIPEGEKIPEEAKEKIMHISLPVGNGNILMGTDAIESMGHQVTIGNNFSISLSPESKDEADKLFNSLSPGGNVQMPLQDMFWGAYYGMLTDKFGIQWMINFDYQQHQVSDKEQTAKA